jgi:hypothetical protein
MNARQLFSYLVPQFSNVQVVCFAKAVLQFRSDHFEESHLLFLAESSPTTTDVKRFEIFQEESEVVLTNRQEETVSYVKFLLRKVDENS